ncbi:unnamed protein product [Protopolystoma xenopodis]|uniref:Uncharacterized protein n=1 Tax=Protopolystoma xenopodis TaxID=117903 RepID=A0A448WSF3_9PLAT|nr:unnamed protein product [Protopolystoma xenopodis]
MLNEIFAFAYKESSPRPSNQSDAFCQHHHKSRLTLFGEKVQRSSPREDEHRRNPIGQLPIGSAGTFMMKLFPTMRECLYLCWTKCMYAAFWGCAGEVSRLVGANLVVTMKPCSDDVRHVDFDACECVWTARGSRRSRRQWRSGKACRALFPIQLRVSLLPLPSPLRLPIPPFSYIRIGASTDGQPEVSHNFRVNTKKTGSACRSSVGIRDGGNIQRWWTTFVL